MIKKFSKFVLLWWTALFVMICVALSDSFTLTEEIISVVFTSIFCYMCYLFISTEDLEQYSGWNLMCKILKIDNTLDE